MHRGKVHDMGGEDEFTGLTSATIEIFNKSGSPTKVKMPRRRTFVAFNNYVHRQWRYKKVPEGKLVKMVGGNLIKDENGNIGVDNSGKLIDSISDTNLVKDDHGDYIDHEDGGNSILKENVYRRLTEEEKNQPKISLPPGKTVIFDLKSKVIGGVEVYIATNVVPESHPIWEKDAWVGDGYNMKALKSGLWGTLLLFIAGILIVEPSGNYKWLNFEILGANTAFLVLILVSSMIYVIFLNWIIVFWEGTRTLKGGAKTGGILGITWALLIAIALIATGCLGDCEEISKFLIIFIISSIIAGAIGGHSFSSQKSGMNGDLLEKEYNISDVHH